MELNRNAASQRSRLHTRGMHQWVESPEKKIGYGWASLARARLHAGDLSSARTAINGAQRYVSQGHNPDLLALAGAIALRTGDSAAAQEAFQAAIAQAESQLSYSEGMFRSLDSKGLALCGLALATGDRDFIPPAMDAYRAAREITKDAGIVANVLRLFDALQEADAAGALTEVREVAAGTKASSTREV
jgi:tetratricopeptide (TPR) repeat protein